MPAAQAGLTQGDVITSAGGQRVNSPEALQTALEQHHPGDSVTIGWTDQSGQAHTATVTLANGPAA
jgi:S1-C subfamily serine protease